MIRTRVLLVSVLFLSLSLTASEPELSIPVRAELEEVVAEKVAARLREFAIALKDGEDLRGFFAAKAVTSRLPHMSRGESVRPWLRRSSPKTAMPFSQVGNPKTASDAWTDWARPLAELLSVQVGLKHAVLDTDLLYGEVSIAIVRRYEGGGIEWLRFGASIVAQRKTPHFFTSLTTSKGVEILDAPRPPFREISEALGVAMQDPPVLQHSTLGLAAYGVAAADVNLDGRLDIVSTGDGGTNLFLRNKDGKYDRVPLTLPRKATGPLFLDFDNDGDPDLFLSANGKQMLLKNLQRESGKLAFEDVSAAMGVDKTSIAFSVAAGDLNGDGVPDLYVTAYNNFGPVLPDSWDDATNGLPNLLFVSKPDGTYEEVAAKWGVAGTDWSYAAQFVDIDEDGQLDLYVANDFGSGNRMYMRRGGRFVDEAKARGLLDEGYGMGVSVSDYDADGDLDLHVTKMSSKAGNRVLARIDSEDLPSRGRLAALASGNSLYRNDGSGKFTDVTKTAGPFYGGWSWGGGFIDIDNDGYEDLHTPNGHLSGTSEADT
ncbi:MAG: VCBS repeat-containing protein [Planctomycetota bacterium]